MVAKNLTGVVATRAQEARQDFKITQKSLAYLARMVTVQPIALDYLLVEQVCGCALANTSCCFYINVTGEIEVSADNILQQATWLGKIKLPQPFGKQ